MATVDVYPREGTTYPDANGVPITSSGARVPQSTYIDRALRKHYLFDWDPLGIYLPEDRSGTGSGETTDVAIQTQGAFALRTFDGTVNAVEILGCTSAGDGGGGIVKRITTDLPPRNALGTRVGLLTAADGSTWVYVPGDAGVNVRFFGALGDDVSTPNQNARGINDALLFDMYYSYTGRTFIPAGQYTLNDSIHVGYGVTFNTSAFGNFQSTTLAGEGCPYDGATFFGGTNLIFTASDRPGICVQGGRIVGVENMSLTGPNLAFVQAGGFGSDTNVSSYDDSVVANWIGPTMNAKFNGQYTPCGAIVIDPRSGTAPVSAYPDVSYPVEFASNVSGGVVSQYGKNFSSQTNINNVLARGWCVPVAIQPCDADGNGDFTTMRDCTFLYNVYGAVSTGNSQSRTLNGQQVNVAYCHTAITNSTHGRQIGCINSEWQNCNFGACIQWLDVGSAGYVGPVKFVGCYGEQVYRLGRWGTSASGNQPLIFDSCNWYFKSQDPAQARGVPRYFLDSTRAQVEFHGCMFFDFFSVLAFTSQPEYITIDRCSTSARSSRTNMYEKVAHNFLCEGLMFAPNPTSGKPARPDTFSCKPVRNFLFDAGTDGDTRVVSSPMPSSRSMGLPAWVQYARPKDTNGAPSVEVPHLWIPVDKSTLTASRSGTTLTLSGFFAGFPFNQYGAMPGDIIWDDLTGSTFFIRSNNGTTVLAELQNNYKGSGTALTTISLTTGNWYFGNARLYLPEVYIKGTFATGSTTVSAVSRADGYGGALTTWIKDADYLYAHNNEYDFNIARADTHTLISSTTNGSPGSFVVSGFPQVAGTRDVGFFIRKAPANV